MLNEFAQKAINMGHCLYQLERIFVTSDFWISKLIITATWQIRFGCGEKGTQTVSVYIDIYTPILIVRWFQLQEELMNVKK